MKHTVVTKFIAILLAACSLVAAAVSACGIAVMGELNLYASNFEETKELYRQERAQTMAQRLLERYAAKELGGCTGKALDAAGRSYTDETLTWWMGLRSDSWAYRIEDQRGRIVDSSPARPEAFSCSYSQTFSTVYPVDIPAEELEDHDVSLSEYRDFYYEGEDIHYLYYFKTEEYTVTVAMAEDAPENYDGIPEKMLQILFSLNYYAIAILAVSLLLFAVCVVYLCCAAGRSEPGKEPVPGGLNKLPLDVYLVGGGMACVGLAWLAVWVLNKWFYHGSDQYNYGALVLVVAIMLIGAIIGVGFLFALAAQLKPKGMYWLKHSVIGFLCWQVWRLIRLCCRGLWKLTRMLPLIWRWALTGAFMGLVPMFNLLLVANGRNFFVLPLLLSILCDLAILCYGAYAFAAVREGAKRMAEGDLNTKISTRYLFGSFRDCAENLNALADVATVAAQNQMRSERMKTELITNVSHDIKTPLTSIINYVDLLAKPHTQEQEQQYLEVLSRQSDRMKKLIDDLMDMSKASTGNMPVEITQMDAVETVNQALGEFADKLARNRLEPVFRHPQEPVGILADGRLTWRVLSNVLNNAVKYAMPGTRVYIDVIRQQEKVIICLKNISREELNVSADELTERFVRGDASRNTEGSGLGLNIARSLMELQKGQLQLLVDGDLFKVTLEFPQA